MSNQKAQPCKLRLKARQAFIRLPVLLSTPYSVQVVGEEKLLTEVILQGKTKQEKYHHFATLIHHVAGITMANAAHKELKAWQHRHVPLC